MKEIIIALITSCVPLVGVIISNTKHQAITDAKIEELTREVREHNNFARRMPVAENEIQHLKDDVKELQHYHK